MVRRDHRRAASMVLRRGARIAYRDPAAEDRTQRRRAECDDYRGPNGGDLRFEPVDAGRDLALRRRLVDAPRAARLPAEVLHRVRQEHVAGCDVCRLDRSSQEAACRSDERLALPVFLIAGLLADQQEPRVTRAAARDALRRALPERTAAA